MHVCVLERDPARAQQIREALEGRGHSVVPAASAEEGARRGCSEVFDLLIAEAELLDAAGPAGSVSLCPGAEVVLLASSTSGSSTPLPEAIECASVPFDLDELVRLVDQLAEVGRAGAKDPKELVGFATIFAGDSPAIQALLRRVRLVARSDASVCVRGEDGAARAVVAKGIHDSSPRRTGAFVAFNAALFPSDARERRLLHGPLAAARSADRGTLFLDDITALGQDAQRGLLRILDERVVETEDRRDVPLDVRLIVGTGANLEIAQSEGMLLHDLYYKIRAIEVDIPPLRERVRDLGAIIEHMLRALVATGRGRRVSTAALKILKSYSFPGNFLELAHALHHAALLAEGAEIRPSHLPASVQERQSEPPQSSSFTDGEVLESLGAVAKRFEREYLLRVLRAVAGNRTRTAEILGLSRKGLWQKLKAHGISDAEVQREDDDGASGGFVRH